MTRPLGPYGACPSRVGRHCPWGHDAHVPRRGRARHLVDPGSFPARRCRCQTLQGRGGAGSPAPLRLRRWCPRWGHSHSWSVCITWWACLSLCLTAGRTAPRRQFRLAGCAPTCARSRWLRVLSGEGGEVGVEILEPFQLSGDLRVDQLQVADKRWKALTLSQPGGKEDGASPSREDSSKKRALSLYSGMRTSGGDMANVRHA
eukprot:CAMPEP_0181470456 /NCGR_PEP_ID=MMETSP1110-20121109/38561_1 /TAXON_ID=174948 /ORGANISM="Symbiodinium sp., Strain CCMP421" /LENGTH=202 /DNA_ID=CAMNT_0023595429 /DNA_START=450 /DNA_END=1059 /DNA_ORIENTATION=+